MKIKKIALLGFIGILGLSSTNAQQLKTPAPSPLQTIDQSFALSNIKIEYSRPSVKGRVIFGDLEQWGKIWRTGANASTKITFGENVKIDGNDLPSGTYALYTIPNKDSWEVLFYKDLTLGGNVAEYKKENEVLRIQVKPSTLPSKVETFTINIADLTSSTANIELLWDKTGVAFSVKADIDAKIMKDIESAVEKDNRPYYTAANYYYENGKDLSKALVWVNKAVEANPKAFWITHLKAKILVKQKNFKDAITTAEQSIAVAKEDKNDHYVMLNEKLIAEAKKSK